MDPLEAFAAHQNRAAESPNYLGDPTVSLARKAAAIDERLLQLKPQQTLTKPLPCGQPVDGGLALSMEEAGSLIRFIETAQDSIGVQYWTFQTSSDGGRNWIERRSHKAPEVQTRHPSPAETAAARAEITELVKSLTWPVKQADGTTVNRPLKLTLSKQDLCFRLWRQDGNATEVQRSWKTDAKVVFFVALHEPRELAPLLSDLQALLIAVYEFVDAQLTTYDEQNLMINVMDSLWEGHHANMAAPAPAPYGTHDSGNAPGLIGNTPSGQN